MQSLLALGGILLILCGAEDVPPPQTHPKDIWVLKANQPSPGPMNLNPGFGFLKENLDPSRYETVAAVGRITGVELARLMPGYPGTIADFRPVRRLTENCPDSIRIYSDNAFFMSDDGPSWVITSDMPCESYFADGDQVLVILSKQAAPLKNNSKSGPFWRPLALWYFKGVSVDSTQAIYQVVSARADEKSIPSLPVWTDLSRFYERRFETKGETLQEGVEAVRALYASLSPKSGHK